LTATAGNPDLLNGDLDLSIYCRALRQGGVHIRLIRCERIGHGRRIGYADFGCTASLYLPAGSDYEISASDHVAAGSDVVGTLVHLTRMASQRSTSKNIGDEKFTDSEPR